MHPSLRIGTGYDFRNTAASGLDTPSLAAMSEPGAQRATRFDSHLLPQGPRTAVLDPWRAALAGSGRDPQDYRVGIIRSCLVTDDVERDWPPVRAADRYRGKVYRSFTPGTGAGGGGALQPIPTRPASRRPGSSAMPITASPNWRGSSANTASPIS